MSSPFVSEKPKRLCGQCQAPWTDDAAACWLCGAAAESTVPVSTKPLPAAPDVNPWYLHGAVWLALIAAAVVGLGVVGAEDETLAWLYALTVGPAILFTLAGAVIGRVTGVPWHPLKKILVFIAAASVSALLTILIAILLLLAAIVAFLQWCFGGMPPG